MLIGLGLYAIISMMLFITVLLAVVLSANKISTRHLKDISSEDHAPFSYEKNLATKTGRQTNGRIDRRTDR